MPAAKPVRNVCRLTLWVNGTSYQVLPLQPSPDVAQKAYRLQKPGGQAYDVAVTPHGRQCSCPDFIYRREWKDARGCKHCRALAACGMI
jgi:hypothetical protein